MGYCEKVRNFTEACHKDLPNKPERMTVEDINFISRMVADEMEELCEADTIEDQADALIDMIYYICNIAARKGINLDPLFNIVHDANMQKIVDGKVIRREDGKVLKPKGWSPPEPLMRTELKRQEYVGSYN